MVTVVGDDSGDRYEHEFFYRDENDLTVATKCAVVSCVGGVMCFIPNAAKTYYCDEAKTRILFSSPVIYGLFKFCSPSFFLNLDSHRNNLCVFTRSSLTHHLDVSNISADVHR